MTGAVVVGYASLDHAVRTGPYQGPAATTEIRARLSEPWPRPGGVAHFLRELRRHGVPASAVTWLGDDAPGRTFVAELRRIGVDEAGVSRDGTRSPSCHLFYTEDTEPVLFFDPGDCPAVLNPAQRAALGKGDWISLSVAPRAVLEDALTAIRPEACLFWTVKADPAALTAGLAAALARRAQVITYSRGERDFLAERCGAAPESLAEEPGRLVVETRGDAEVAYWFAGRSGTVSVTPVTGPDADTTGAGDTFAAALLAGVAGACGRDLTALTFDDVAGLVADASEAATTLLVNRQSLADRKAGASA